MGRCWKCGCELRLDGDEFICDNCNKIMGYSCWNCKNYFEVRNPKTKKKINECNICGYFYCPHCGTCGPNCDKNLWDKKILNILNGKYNIKGELIISDIEKKLKRIIDFIEELKNEKKDHHVCPYGVYSSYSRGYKGKQGKIKQLLAKMNGIGVKSNLDAASFRKKLAQIIIFPQGKSFMINDIREDGRYGQEERDACNLGICMRELTGVIKTKNKKKGILYTRLPKPKTQCFYLRQDNYITTRCPNCHKNFSNPKLQWFLPKATHCPNCIYKKGKNKGQQYELKKKETNTFICNCPWEKYSTIKSTYNIKSNQSNSWKKILNTKSTTPTNISKSNLIPQLQKQLNNKTLEEFKFNPVEVKAALKATRNL